MTEHSTRINLSYLQPAQAQKHVTVNESLRMLDALVQLAVVSATVSAQPASPVDGDCYILPAGKSGTAWGAMADGAIAQYTDGAWFSHAPREGWIAHVNDTDQMLVYSGSAWSALSTRLRLSTTDRILGRVSPGAGAAEEIAFTDQAQALCDDASASEMRATLGLGSAAVQNTGTSGANVPLLNAANTWGAAQTAPAIGISSSFPYFTLQDTDGGTNEKNYRFVGNSSFFEVTFINDAFSTESTAFRLARSGTTLQYALFAGAIIPGTDDSFDLGTASMRWDDVYATNGTIQTSDAREKTPLAPLSDALKRAVRRAFKDVGVFQWLSSVAEKGGDYAEGGARLHVGVTAQTVAAAFAAEGLDARHYGLFCESDGRQGLRLGQLMLLALACLFERSAADAA